MKKSLVLLIMFLAGNIGLCAPQKTFQANAVTKRIPQGTRLELQLIDPISTVDSSTGDCFSAMLITDQIVDDRMVLPQGSIIRGTVKEIYPQKRLSKGAVLYIDFDHIVTPNGRQLPLSAGICNREKLTLDGGMYENKNYGEALLINAKTAGSIVTKATKWGLAKDGTARYILTPVGALSGTFAGGIYLVGDSVFDLFRKGENVVLHQGTNIFVVLIKPLDIPVI